MRIPPGAGLLVIAATLIAASACTGGEQSLRQADKVRICHDPPTSKRQSVPVSQIVGENGHANHPTDIIPDFEYLDENGDTQTFPGLNWEDEQDVWDNDCGSVQPVPTTTTAPPTTSTTTTTTTTAPPTTSTTTTTTTPDGTTTTTTGGATTTTTGGPTTTTAGGTTTTTTGGTTTTTVAGTTTTTGGTTTTTGGGTTTSTAGGTTTTTAGETTTTTTGETTTTTPGGTTTTTVAGQVTPPIEPQDPTVVLPGCSDCPDGPTIVTPETPGIAYEVSPAGPWAPGQTVTVTARFVEAASGFAEPLPQGWRAVDPSTAAFDLTVPSGGLARTGPASAVPQAVAAAAAIGLGSLLLVISRRRRRAP